MECLEVIVDQSLQLAFYFIIHLGKFALECHLVSQYFHSAEERLIRHLLRRNEASFFFRCQVLEFLFGVYLIQVGLDLFHFVVVHFRKDLLTAVNFLIDVLFHVFLALQIILDFEIELIPW